MKTILKASLAAFITVFATDFLIHGVLLKEMYMETASLWRPESEMSSYFPWMLLGQLWVSFFFTWIFSYGWKGKGLGEGIRYGLLMGAFQMGNQFIMYAVAPYPLTLTFAWIVSALFQGAVVGVVIERVFSKCAGAHDTYKAAA